MFPLESNMKFTCRTIPCTDPFRPCHLGRCRLGHCSWWWEDWPGWREPPHPRCPPSWSCWWIPRCSCHSHQTSRRSLSAFALNVGCVQPSQVTQWQKPFRKTPLEGCNCNGVAWFVQYNLALCTRYGQESYKKSNYDHLIFLWKCGCTSYPGDRSGFCVVRRLSRDFFWAWQRLWSSGTGFWIFLNYLTSRVEASKRKHPVISQSGVRQFPQNTILLWYDRNLRQTCLLFLP